MTNDFASRITCSSELYAQPGQDSSSTLNDDLTRFVLFLDLNSPSRPKLKQAVSLLGKLTAVDDGGLLGVTRSTA